MRFRPSGLAKAAFSLCLLLVAAFAVSCSGSGSTSGTTTSGLTFRAFVSNPLQPLSTGGGVPVINIVDATHDTLSGSRISLTGSTVNPGLMAVSPDRRFTLVLSNPGSLAIVENATESLAVDSAGRSLPAVSLPGTTESLVVSPNGTTAYLAVPNATVVGQPSGAVVGVNYATGAVSTTIPVPAAHYISQSPDGNTLLVFSDNSDVVTLIAASLIGSGTDPVSTICCFDRPVAGVFTSDNSTAYILSCGAECGGIAASVTPLNLNDSSVGLAIPVDAATTGLLNGNTLYVAGTPPANGANTCSATSCGRFDTVDVTALAKTGSAVIADGYHNRMELGANGQVFVGARACTNVSSASEIRGCLSIVNTTSNLAATVAPVNGDVTGIAPITGRNVVYVCENGELYIYDTTTDQLQSTQVDIVGKAMDVKLVDGAP